MIASQIASIGKSSMDIIISTLEKEPQLLSHHTVGVPAELQRIVSKALCKDREERYQTARDMWIDLKNLKEEIAFESKLERSGSPEMRRPVRVAVPVQHSVVTNSSQAIPASSPRKRLSPAVIASLIVVVIGLVGVKMWLSFVSTRSDVPSPVAVERALNYWVTVQKYRDGKQ